MKTLEHRMSPLYIQRLRALNTDNASLDHTLFPQGPREKYIFMWHHCYHTGLRHLWGQSPSTSMTQRIAQGSEVFFHQWRTRPLPSITYPIVWTNHLRYCARAVWHWAGDTSLDISYYTKRTLLMGVWVAAWPSMHHPHHAQRLKDMVYTLGRGKV